MGKEHCYKTSIRWTGNTGEGTRTYRSYERSYTISIPQKPDLLASSDPAFRGDLEKHNPEDLFLSSLSGCHMLWYLHLCAVNRIVVVAYSDQAKGIMEERENSSGFFREVTLNPVVKVTKPSMVKKAIELHCEANRLCFIANSVNFPVHHQPLLEVEEEEKGVLE